MDFTGPQSIRQIREYKEYLANKRPEDEPVYKNLELAKQTVWLSLLMVLFLIYYLIDILQQCFDLLMSRV